MHRAIATCLLALLLQACKEEGEAIPFPSTSRADQGLQGPVTDARLRHFERNPNSTGWSESDGQQWQYDPDGLLQEHRAWKRGRARTHILYAHHAGGGLRLEDQRVLQGKPGGQRRFHASGSQAFAQEFNAAGQLVERVERETDAQGRLLRRSQVIYRRENGRDREATRLEWRTSYLGGDSVRKTMHKNGALKEEELLVGGGTVSISFNDDQGKLERRGKPAPAENPGETRFVYHDASGRMVEMRFETQLPDGGSSSEVRVLNADGSVSSMQVEVTNAMGRVIASRYWQFEEGGAAIIGPETRYLYQDDAQGNWILKVLLEDGRMREVWARGIVYGN